MKRVLIALLGLALVAAAGFLTIVPPYADRQLNALVQAPPYPVSEAAQQLHDSLFVADLHDDLLLWSRDPLERHDYGHSDIPRLIEGNVGLQVFSVVTKSPRGQNPERNEDDSDRITLLAVAQRWPLRTWVSLKERALYQAERLRKAAAQSDGRFIVIRSRADLERYVARRANNPEILAGLLAMEGLHSLEHDFASLDAFHDAGYRMLGLAHFIDNEVSGSAHGVEQGGLTEFGRRVVNRMEERGILIDLAHTSARTIEDVLAMATRPVVVSHTGVQGTCPGPRNLSDDQLRGIAATGGLVGIGFWPGAVCGASIGAIIEAIRHAVGVIGAEHVSLGSDFDGTTRVPFDASGMGLLTEALLDEGFTREQIRLIMGENVLRVLRATLPPRS